MVAPKWDEVAADGDFDFLPADLTSVAGGRLIGDAFPGVRTQSQLVMVLARPSSPLQKSDEAVALDLQRRLHYLLAQVATQRYLVARSNQSSGSGADRDVGVEALAALVTDSYDRAIAADEAYYELVADRLAQRQIKPTANFPRLASAYWDRGKWDERIGKDEESIGNDFEAALTFYPDLPSEATDIEQRDLSSWKTLLDVLSWDDSVIGAKLQTESARLAVLRLSSELAATSNIAVVESALKMIDEIQTTSGYLTTPGLQLKITGSAAIGGETLMAARDAIRYTEFITVISILLILGIVYRAPMLVIVPMASIGIAVIASLSLVTIIAKATAQQWIPGLDFRIFTTSRIFIVVILFGAGTDYCLFLISRLREEWSRRPWLTACGESLSGVSGALLGSAGTTIVGLGMLIFADFEKFQFTGPIIAICLSIGLAVCLTLTPAILAVVGPKSFWPAKLSGGLQPWRNLGANDSTAVQSTLWTWMALMLTRRPMLWLVMGILVLLIPGWYGWQNESSVTYDISSELDSSSDSRQGLKLLGDHFKIGEINPITIVLLREKPVPRKQADEDVKRLSKHLYGQDKVIAVRTADDPLGDFPPDREMGLLSADAWKRRALRKHRSVQNYFFSSTDTYKDRLMRLDVAIEGDPFKIETASTVESLRTQLHQWIEQPGSGLKDTRLFITGTTASLIDLRTVITRDNLRIKIAVMLAVLAVLVMVIRRIGLCLYLIATVLLSYYATLGLTVGFFRWAYGNEYVGLDWKLPVFLFVILMAIGQDYNVYLVARILEEEKHLGWLAALRRAVSRTGGIITACGLVMAATFFSMTSSAWMPTIIEYFTGQPEQTRTLRGIVELGFALGLGMLVDTLYVRTVLVPSFVAILGRRKPATR
jgi:putative drug exporter of the RND superfamily